jgi:transcriptional regulator with XRE-family HTH domain
VVLDPQLIPFFWQDQFTQVNWKVHLDFARKVPHIMDKSCQFAQSQYMWHFQKHPSFTPGALKQLANLGERLRLARCRRKLTAVLFAERMGVSRETLRRLEKGDPTIAIATYLRALRVLGLDKDIDMLARDDELGRKLQDITLLDGRGTRRGGIRKESE